MMSIVLENTKIITLSTLVLISMLYTQHNESNEIPETYQVQSSEKVYQGEYQVIVKKVDDGDTIMVDIPNLTPLIGQSIGIRFDGIDAPEIHDRRPAVKAIALQAKEYLKSKLDPAQKVVIKNIKRDKYFRIVATVFADDTNLNQLMLDQKLAKPYNGGKKTPW